MKIQYRNNLLAFLIPSILIGASACSPKINSRKAVDHSEQQTRMMLTEISKAENKKGDLVSPRTIENSQLKLVSSKDWTSGFFPGQLCSAIDANKGFILDHSTGHRPNNSEIC